MTEMYKTIVRSKLRATFKALNTENTVPFFKSLGSPFQYRFAGDSPLSGERSTVESMQAWWKRVFTLLPGAQFTVGDITVNGMPWNTTVMTYVTVASKLADGTAYSNEFMQMMTLKFGKITNVVTIEDTQRLATAMQSLAQTTPEATASPIVDVRR
jgi:ketosteroid isomerase-like protein